MDNRMPYQCSNCGKWVVTEPWFDVSWITYFKEGSKAVGDAFYCEDCVKTWKERNGKDFEEQYGNSQHRFAKWWSEGCYEG